MSLETQPLSGASLTYTSMSVVSCASCIVLESLVCVSEKKTFQEGPGVRGECEAHRYRRNRVVGSGNHTCKGPGAGPGMVFWRNSEDAHVAGAE